MENLSDLVITVKKEDILKFAKEIGIRHGKTDEVLKSATNELGARFLRRVILLTPVGEYGDIATYNRDNRKKGIFKGDAKRDKYGNIKRLSTKSVSFTTKSGATVSFSARARRGGTLRKGWRATQARKSRNGYSAYIYNNTHYAIYVEYGHMTRNRTRFIKGRYMMKKSLDELSRIQKTIVEKHIGRIIE